MARVTSGRHVLDEKIRLDGKAFRACTFENCELVYAGGGDVELTACRFVNCSWTIRAPAAAGLEFLKWMYALDGAAREAAEGFIAEIRKV